MRASVIGLALFWGIAAHAQAPTKTTELQARSYLLSAFISGAAPLIMAPSATITPELRSRLRLPADADVSKVYDAMVDVASAERLQVRPARAEEIVKAGAKTEFRKPLYAVLAGGTIFVVQYDLDADHVIFAGDASGAPAPPAPIVQKPVPAAPPAPAVAIPVPTPPPAPPPAPVVVAPPAPLPAPIVAAPPVTPPPPPAAVAAPAAAAAPAPIVVEPKEPRVAKPAPPPAPTRQAAVAPSRIAAPAAAPAAAPTLRPTGPCVVKPVMSEQDLANCAQREPRARMTAETKPQAPAPAATVASTAPGLAPAQRTCVIKPVMSEEDLAICAKRDAMPKQAAQAAPTPSPAAPAAAAAPATLGITPSPRTCVIKPVMSEEDLAVCAKRDPSAQPASAPKPVATSTSAAPPAAPAIVPAPRQCVIKPVMSEEDLAACRK